MKNTKKENVEKNSEKSDEKNNNSEKNENNDNDPNENENTENETNENENKHSCTTNKKKKSLPIIVVCNKMDDLENEEVVFLVEEVRAKVEEIFAEDVAQGLPAPGTYTSFVSIHFIRTTF